MISMIGQTAPIIKPRSASSSSLRTVAARAKHAAEARHPLGLLTQAMQHRLERAGGRSRRRHTYTPLRWHFTLSPGPASTASGAILSHDLRRAIRSVLSQRSSRAEVPDLARLDVLVALLLSLFGLIGEL